VLKDMKPNEVKKDGNKTAFDLSNEDISVSGIASVLDSPFISLARNSASVLCVLHCANSSFEAIHNAIRISSIVEYCSILFVCHIGAMGLPSACLLPGGWPEPFVSASQVVMFNLCRSKSLVFLNS
jgi:hypothetical protein